jgi:hypothetical protein
MYGNCIDLSELEVHIALFYPYFYINMKHLSTLTIDGTDLKLKLFIMTNSKVFDPMIL